MTAPFASIASRVFMDVADEHPDWTWDEIMDRVADETGLDWQVIIAAVDGFEPQEMHA